MPTTFLSGDILEAAKERGGARALAFGTDCSGAMESGIAAACKTHFPSFAAAYRAHCESNSMQLGDVFEFDADGLTIYALGLQRGGAKPKFSTFERATASMLERATASNIHAILLPRLGGGKVGLDWTRVKKLLVDLGRGAKLQLIVFEKFVRKTGDSPAM